MEKAKIAEGVEDYEETKHLDTLFDPAEYEVRVLTDNPNTRVLMFLDDNGQQRYKTVYVKHDGFLKVIDLTENRLIEKKKI